MIVRITNQNGTVLQQDSFPGAGSVNIGIDPETFRKLLDGQRMACPALLDWHLLRIEVLPDMDEPELSAPAAVPSDCPWCTDTYVDLGKHLRVCPERLGPRDTARLLRLIHSS